MRVCCRAKRNNKTERMHAHHTKPVARRKMEGGKESTLVGTDGLRTDRLGASPVPPGREAPKMNAPVDLIGKREEN